MIKTETEEIVRLVNKYVNDKLYDREKLIAYLSSHIYIGAEVFDVGRRELPNDSAHFNGINTFKHVDEDTGFFPVDIVTFLNRLPFYYYVPTDNKEYGCLRSLAYGYYDYVIAEKEAMHRAKAGPDEWDEFYNMIESLYYDYNISLKDIFTYINQQTNHTNRFDIFKKWYMYVGLCKQLGWNDYTPVNILYSLNLALEAVGKEPYIYELDYSMGFNEPFIRERGVIKFGGEFPVNPENGELIKRWVSIWMENEKYIKVHGYRKKEDKNDGIFSHNSLHVELEIGLLPETIIYATNIDELDDDDYPIEYQNNIKDVQVWTPVYFGPKVMQFDNRILRVCRNNYKMKQSDVAERLGISLRTYQNYEIGATIPDALTLIKLINLFDIKDIQLLCKEPYLFTFNYDNFKKGYSIGNYVV